MTYELRDRTGAEALDVAELARITERFMGADLSGLINGAEIRTNIRSQSPRNASST